MLMQDKATAEQIEAYLYDIATNYIGISASVRLKECCAETANILQNKRPEFEQAMQQSSHDKGEE